MPPYMVFFGALCALLGALALYAATPQQKLPVAPPPRLAGISGGVLLLSACGLLMTRHGIAAALFVLLTLVMLAWSLLPLALAWLRHDGASR